MTKCCHRQRWWLFSSPFHPSGISSLLDSTFTSLQSLCSDVRECLASEAGVPSGTRELLGSGDVVSLSVMGSETPNCFNNKAGRPRKAGQQQELRRVGMTKFGGNGRTRFVLLCWEESASSWRTGILQGFNKEKPEG